MSEPWVYIKCSDQPEGKQPTVGHMVEDSPSTTSKPNGQRANQPTRPMQVSNQVTSKSVNQPSNQVGSSVQFNKDKIQQMKQMKRQI